MCLNNVKKFDISKVRSLCVWIALFIANAFLSACSDETPFPRCIDATDFSSSDTVVISASLSESDTIKATSDDGQDTNAFGDTSVTQVIRWEDTGFTTSGDALNVKAIGMWIPWAKSGAVSAPVGSASLTPDELNKPDDQKSPIFGSLVSTDRECNPYDMVIPSGKQSCNSIACRKIATAPDNAARGFYGGPCWVKNGNGAYLLFKRPQDPEPNVTLDVMKYPESPVVHIGYDPAELGGRDMYSSAEHKIIDAQCGEVTLERGWRIYAKILDTYYWDNAGGYAIRFASGAIKDNGVYILEAIRKEVKKYLIDEGGAIVFTRIVANPTFKQLALSMLSLFLMFSVTKYLLGLVDQPASQLVVIIAKVAFISLLISENSWTFFHDHLIGLFADGTDMMIALVNTGSGVPFDPAAPFASLDIMIQDRIFANTVWNMKMKALIVSNFWGIFGCLIIILAVLVYLMMLGYAFIMYLTSLVGVALLVGIAPILFLGILFDKTKPLFDGWITCAVGLALQAIMIFTLVAMFGAMIMNTYYRTLGFTTCYNPWFNFNICIAGGCIIDKTYSTWTPGSEDSVYIKKVLSVLGSSDANDKLDSSLPNAGARFQFLGGASVIKVPPEYKEDDYRYKDYPYFDPDATGQSFDGGTPVKIGSKFAQLAAYLDTAKSLQSSKRMSAIVQAIATELRRLKANGDITAAVADAAIAAIEASATTNINVQNATAQGGGDDYEKVLPDLEKAILAIINPDLLPAPDPTKIHEQYDYQIIQNIRKGDLIIWPELGILLLMGYLMWSMKELVQHTGKGMSGVGAFPGAILGDAYTGLFHPQSGGIGGKIGSVLSGIKYKAQDLMPGFISKEASMLINASGVKNLARIPVVGTMAKASFSVAKSLTGFGSDAIRELKAKERSKNLTYVRAVIGAHLMAAGQPLTNPWKAFKNMASGSSATGDSGILGNIMAQRKVMMEKLSDQILGPEARATKALRNIKGADGASGAPGGIEAGLSKYDDEHSLREVFKDFKMLPDGTIVLNTQADVRKLVGLRSQLTGVKPENRAEAELVNQAIERIDKSLKGKLGENYKAVIDQQQMASERASPFTSEIAHEAFASSPGNAVDNSDRGGSGFADSSAQEGESLISLDKILNKDEGGRHQNIYGEEESSFGKGKERVSDAVHVEPPAPEAHVSAAAQDYTSGVGEFTAATPEHAAESKLDALPTEGFGTKQQDALAEQKSSFDAEGEFASNTDKDHGLHQTKHSETESAAPKVHEKEKVDHDHVPDEAFFADDSTKYQAFGAFTPQAAKSHDQDDSEHAAKVEDTSHGPSKPAKPTEDSDVEEAAPEKSAVQHEEKYSESSATPFGAKTGMPSGGHDAYSDVYESKPQDITPQQSVEHDVNLAASYKPASQPEPVHSSVFDSGDSTTPSVFASGSIFDSASVQSDNVFDAPSEAPKSGNVFDVFNKDLDKKPIIEKEEKELPAQQPEQQIPAEEQVADRTTGLSDETMGEIHKQLKASKTELSKLQKQMKSGLFGPKDQKRMAKLEEEIQALEDSIKRASGIYASDDQ